MMSSPTPSSRTLPPVANELLEWNRTQRAEFSSSRAKLARQLYRNQHPTEFAILKCMDGRLNLALMTKTPPGILYPFRSMGGKFSLGSPWFGDLIDEWILYAINKGRRAVIIVTYHFSRSNNEHLGCKGWGYDRAAAEQAARDIVSQIRHVYGTGYDTVSAIVAGIETDEDALVFHGDGLLDVSTVVTEHEEAVFTQLRTLYKEMHPQVLADLFELVKGNMAHIKELRHKKRAPIDMDHRENIIAVGRGFDWLHIPNRALIIGPYDHGWPMEVVTAGKIILGNLKAGRIQAKDGFLLLCSSAFRKERGTGTERPRSELRAADMARVARKALEEHVPEVSFCTLVGKVDMDTRELFVLE